ncbi:MAG: ABC transporter permease, partial [Balneolales bacterium]
MLINRLKAGIQNLLEVRARSAFSIWCLAIGVVCCFLLLLYVRFEWSYDSFHENSDNIYRLVKQSIHQETDQVLRDAGTPPVMAPYLESTFPELEKVVRQHKASAGVKMGEVFTEEEILFADEGFFQMFSFSLMSGNEEAVLADPDEVVISEYMAQRFFGDGQQAIGEEITIQFFDEERSYRISGVAEQVPLNSSNTFHIVLPFENVFYNFPPGHRDRYRDNWSIYMAETYVLLNQNTPVSQLNEKFPRFLVNHYGIRSIYYQQKRMWLQPFNEVYFD